MEFTLFEIHLDDASFSSGSDMPFSSSETSSTSSEGSGGFPLMPVLGIVVLAGVALAARKFLGSGEPLTEEESEIGV